VLTTETIRALFVALNDELASRGVLGEVGLCGGAVMCLVFQARSSTKDVDAVFEPTREIREAQHDVMELPNLRVWAPAADYMLAMKCVSARFDSHDRGDVEFLIRHLGLETPAAVFEVICRFYPRERVPAKTAFFVEEILQG